MSQQTESSELPRLGQDPNAILLGLQRTRARTLDLIAPISDESLSAQHSRLMSPIAWDMGHIAAFEQLWLVDRLGQASTESELEDTYDAFRTPRSERGGLALLDRVDIRARMAVVRGQVESRLETSDLASDNPLLSGGFAWELVRQHEAQHQETVLQTIQLRRGEDNRPVAGLDGDRKPEPIDPGRTARAGQMVRVPGGVFEMGWSEDAFSYDNERPAFTVDVPSFEIGVHPVTSGEYAEFIAAGGYTERQLWSEEGWAWREEAGLFAPHYWLPRVEASRALPPDPAAPFAGRTTGLSAEEAAEITRAEGLSGWRSRTSLGSSTIVAEAPVIHVCFHEAEAYARFAGARLPTEAEWEKAAAWDPDTGRCLPYPWGEAPPSRAVANVDQVGFGVRSIGTYPGGTSPVGCQGLHGDAWEWTSSQFAGYPGFVAFPYPEYSEVFFGSEYRVLRGSAWATAGSAVRNTFRNWDYPIRRQIFSGLRLARDT